MTVMDCVILIPVKGFAAAKQRLSPVLNSSERSALASAMLWDVFEALSNWERRPQVAVVTGDEVAATMTRSYGFAIIEDAECLGETEAISAATSAFVGRGVRSAMVIPGDIPLVTATELQAVLDALPENGGPASVLAPAADGRGTNAVLRRPVDLFPLRFGNDSFEPHWRAARATGHACSILRLPGIGLDVDAPADLAALLREPVSTNSQRLLVSWRLRERLTDYRAAPGIGAPATS